MPRSAETPTTIVWFDRDLRTADHAPLAAAAARGRVVPLFVWSPDDEAPWAPGAAYRWFLGGALRSLSRDLDRLGAPLVVRTGDAHQVIAEVAAATGADAVHVHRRYTPALAARDSKVADALRVRGIAWRAFDGWLLHRPEEVRTGSAGPYRVFTPFWRRFADAVAPGDPAPRPARLERPSMPLQSLDVADLQLPSGEPWAKRLEGVWDRSESAARARLDAFALRSADGYAEGRDRLGEDATSRLSPYLAHGLLSPRQVWARIGAEDPFERGTGRAEFLRQLVWREFAWHVLTAFPATSDDPMQDRYRAFRWRDDSDDLARWQRGRTGFPVVDAAMRELWQTGWMHNRARMVTASFLTKDLLLHWRDGARWFWETLVDADLANNTMGWQWVAGCGADAAPFFRVFDPTAQADRHDPDRAYRARWLPPDGLSGLDPMLDHRTARQRALDRYAAIR